MRVPERTGDRTIRFSQVMVAPRGENRLLIRYAFRWATTGRSTWSYPLIRPVRWRPRRPVKVCVVTGATGGRPTCKTIRQNLDYYGSLCRHACAELAPDLIVLPEIALQYGIDKSALETAVPAPGPETRPFQQLARRAGCHIVLGMFERENDAAYNSAVLIDPDGDMKGK